MTREKQLEFCKICTRQKFDFKQGIICGLTDLPASFESTCEFYQEDPDLKMKHESTKSLREIQNKLAGKGTRFANYLLDLVFLLIFGVIFGFFLGIFLSIISPNLLSLITQDNRLVNYILGFFAGMIYFSTFEAATGRTIAKFITKTKVINENGEKPDFGTILIRSLCRFIPFEPLSFLLSETSGWHDRLSKTLVVEN
jgi:uncharacterized RDD family membrane protein YckC